MTECDHDSQTLERILGIKVEQKKATFGMYEVEQID